MRAMIDAGDVGAVSLAVVLLQTQTRLSQIPIPIPHQLVHYALTKKTKTTDILHALLSVPEIAASASALDENGDTALMIASVNGDTEAVTVLHTCPTVAQSAGAADARGNTALMLASSRGHTQAVVALLACPAVVQSAGAVDTNGETALMIAILASANGYTKVVHALENASAHFASSLESTFSLSLNTLWGEEVMRATQLPSHPHS